MSQIIAESKEHYKSYQVAPLDDHGTETELGSCTLQRTELEIRIIELEIIKIDLTFEWFKRKDKALLVLFFESVSINLTINGCVPMQTDNC